MKSRRDSSGGGGEAGFLTYELENNRLLHALRLRPEFSDILEYIKDKEAIILVPQSASIGELFINRSFIETHVVLLSPDGSGRLMSVNGVRALFLNPEREIIHVVAAPPSDESELVEMVTNPLSAFGPGSVFAEFKPEKRNLEDDVHVLRQGRVQIAAVSAGVLLVSRPLTFSGGPWVVDQYGVASSIESASTGADRVAGHHGDAHPHAVCLSAVAAVAAPPVGRDSNPATTEALLIDLESEAAPSELHKPMSTTEAAATIQQLQQQNTDRESSRLLPRASPSPVSAAQFEADLLSWSSTQNVANTAPRELSPASRDQLGDPRPHESAPPMNMVRKKAPSTMSDFKEKMRDPSCYYLVKSIKTFIDAVKADKATLTPDVLSERFQEFLRVMDDRFAQHAMWQNDVDLAMEGLEKYVLSVTEVHGVAFNRYGDVVQNTRLANRIDALSFLTAENLDIKLTGNLDASLQMAGAELQAMNKYRAPRAKLVCLVNACKIILTRLMHATDAKEPASADDFLPVLIYVILKTNPTNFKANLLYIERFRYQQRLGSEQAYYFTTVLSAVEFIERADATMLSISADEFDTELAKAQVRLNADVGPKSSQPTTGAPPGGGGLSLGGLLPSSIKEGDWAAMGSVPQPKLGKSTSHYLGKIQSFLADPLAKSGRRSNTDLAGTTAEASTPLMSGESGEYLDRATLSMLLKSMYINYERPEPRYREITAEEVTPEEVPVLLYEYQRLAAYTDHLMETMYNIHQALGGGGGGDGQ